MGGIESSFECGVRTCLYGPNRSEVSNASAVGQGSEPGTSNDITLRIQEAVVRSAVSRGDMLGRILAYMSMSES